MRKRRPSNGRFDSIRHAKRARKPWSWESYTYTSSDMKRRGSTFEQSIILYGRRTTESYYGMAGVAKWCKIAVKKRKLGVRNENPMSLSKTLDSIDLLNYFVQSWHSIFTILCMNPLRSRQVKVFLDAVEKLHHQTNLSRFTERVFDVIEHLIPGVLMTAQEFNLKTKIERHWTSTPVPAELIKRSAELVPIEHPIFPLVTAGSRDAMQLRESFLAFSAPTSQERVSLLNSQSEGGDMGERHLLRNESRRNAGGR